MKPTEVLLSEVEKIEVESLEEPASDPLESLSEEREEEESTESGCESSDDGSISSESGIRSATGRIRELSSLDDVEKSREKLFKIMKHSYRILSYFSRQHGETSPKIHKHYLHYAEAFFKLLRWNLEQGLHDETEDASVRDDWDVVVECLRRAIACAERGINQESPNESDSKGPLHTIQCALEHLTWIYVYRENPKEALSSAESLYRRFPSVVNAINLAEVHVLNEHFSSAKSLIGEIREGATGLDLTKEQIAKVEELYELLFQNDPSKIKWDVKASIQKEYQIHKHKKNTDGNIVTHFTLPGESKKESSDACNVPTNVIATRRKRKEPSETDENNDCGAEQS